MSSTKLLKSMLLAAFSLNIALGANIHPISREEGSGTRGAFVEIFDLLQKVGDKKIDTTTQKAEITNSTAIMLTTVQNDKNAIGYISLGSLNDSVKAISIEGVKPSIQNIKDKKYLISRPFNVVTKKEDALISDFLAFATSKQAAEIVNKAGYISLEASDYKPKNPSGKIVVAGSSSVTPLMEKLKEAYIANNPKAIIEVQQSDSTTGINATLQGVADVGMLSRELKQSELDSGLKVQVLAIDGLAIIVNPKNAINNLNKAQVKAIFSGSINQWEDIK